MVWWQIEKLELKYSIDFLDMFLVRDHDIESKLCVDKFSLRTYVVLRNVPDRHPLFFPALAFTCVSVGRSASFPLAKSTAGTRGHVPFFIPHPGIRRNQFKSSDTPQQSNDGPTAASPPPPPPPGGLCPGAPHGPVPRGSRALECVPHRSRGPDGEFCSVMCLNFGFDLIC